LGASRRLREGAGRLKRLRARPPMEHENHRSFEAAQRKNSGGKGLKGKWKSAYLASLVTTTIGAAGANRAQDRKGREILLPEGTPTRNYSNACKPDAVVPNISDRREKESKGSGPVKERGESASTLPRSGLSRMRFVVSISEKDQARFTREFSRKGKPHKPKEKRRRPEYASNLPRQATEQTRKKKRIQ